MYIKILLFSMTLVYFLSGFCYGQLEHYKQIKIGQLQSWYSRAGAEIEVGRTGLISDQQDGLRWMGQFEDQDTEAAKALWIGCVNYDDPIVSQTFAYKVVHIGPKFIDEQNEFMPVEFKMTGRFDNPQVFVNGAIASDLHAGDADVDEINPAINYDRIIYNVVNTSIGITVKRKIYAFTNQGHDNYYIYDYTFKNTGIYDINGSTQNVTLDGVVFFFQYRYSPTREACTYGGAWLPQNVTWGRGTMNDVTFTHPSSGALFRTQFSWLGLHSGWNGAGDNLGGPNWVGDGHLGAAQYVGTITLHVDTSPQNNSDDPNQPSTTHYLGSDDAINAFHNQFNASQMVLEYAAMMAGHPPQTHAQAVGNGYVDQWGTDAGGYSQTKGFGPYTMQHGDSIHIILAEGVAGLDREQCYTVGANWLDWVNGGSSPYTLPNGGTTTNGNDYKNAWVKTGQDSIVKTFDNAQSNYNSGINLPAPPIPPDVFEVNSSLQFIRLTWNNNATTMPNFSGYEIYRSVLKPDTTFEKIFECGPNTSHPMIVHTFDDTNVNLGFSYYYYLVTVDDGSTNGGIQMRSSIFWTRTNQPAFLVSGLEDKEDIIPKQFSLHQNYPNPFNPTTTIEYDLPKYSKVLLEIYDMMGRKIKTLINESQIPGEKSITWDSRNDYGQKVASGLYIYKLVAGNHVKSRKMLLMK